MKKGDDHNGKITRRVTERVRRGHSQAGAVPAQRQWLENRIKYYQQGDRKKRNHRLITRGAAVESVVPDVRGMSERAFFLLVEKVFFLPEVAAQVRCAADQQEDR